MGMIGIRQRVADHDLGQPSHGHDVAGDRLVGGRALDALGREQLGDLGVGDHRQPVHLAHPRHLVALAQLSLVDADQGEPAEEGRRVQVGHQRLQRRLGVPDRRRDVLHQHVEQRVQVVARGHLAVGGLGGAGHPGATGRVQRRQAQRMLGGRGRFVVEIGGDVEQQVVAGLHDLGDARVGPVRLVDDENHRQMRGQRLAQHEPGLRQRALGCVDQQQHAVHHGQPALHLAAEVGVSRGVDDVDHRDGPIRVVAVHGGVLGQDGDALFPFQVTAVHDAILHFTAFVQGARLPQHRVDQGGLAVVDVGDDGDVAEWHVGDCGSGA